MAQVITFVDYTPAPRYDGNPWEDVEIQESDSSTLSDDTVWTTIETIALSPVDADPENPATRSFTTEDADDAFDLWYRLVFIDGTGDEQQPTAAVQNVQPLSGYATSSELARILKLRSTSEAQDVALRRVIAAASAEIDDEIDLADDGTIASRHMALVNTVCLERAAEHWAQQEIQFGLVFTGDAALGGGAERLARDTWERHALKLAPVKDQWGLA
jgi:hypothetical protein